MATEIQRILIKYEADIKQLKTQLDTIQGELKDTEKVSDKSTKEVQKDFEKTAKSAGGVTNALKSVGAAIAAAYSVREIIQFTKESVRLADVQLKAEAQLLTALKGRKEAQQELIKQAADLQKKTTFGDEETIAAQARIAAFVQEVDQIKELTRVSQDFASAKGIDLATASDLITKSFASSTNALSRYGIEIEGTAGSSERLTNIVKGLDNAFKGQAEVIANTGLGPLIQIQNAIGDVREEIGKAILKELPGFTEQLSKGVNVISAFATQLFNAEERTGKIGRVAEITQKYFENLIQVFRNVVAPIEALFTVVGKLLVNLGLISEGANNFEGALKLVERAVYLATRPLQFLSDVLLNIAGVWNGVIDAFRVGAESLSEVFNSIGDAADLALKGKFKQAAESIGDFDFKGVSEAFNQGFQEIVKLNDPKVKAEAEKTGERIGVDVATGIPKGLQSSEGQKAIDEAILELQKQFDLTEFRLRFRIDPEGLDFAEKNPIPIEPIDAVGSSLDNLIEKIQAYGRVRQQTSDEIIAGIAREEQAELARQAQQQQTFDDAAQIFTNIGVLIGEGAEFQKSIALLTIGLNQSKAISSAIASAAAIPFPGNIPAIISSIAAITGLFAQVKQLYTASAGINTAPGFAVGTSSAPGGEALVGEKGPERMFVPKGARIYTSEATKKESKLIDALNAGKHEDFIHDHYIRPFAAQMMQRTQEPYNDFQLRQAIKGNKVVKLHPETMRKLAPVKIKRYR